MAALLSSACDDRPPLPNASLDGAVAEVGGNGDGGTGGDATGMGGTGGTGPACASAVTAGNAAAVALGSLTIVRNNIVLGRDAQGLYAMSAICTHQGCMLSVVATSPQASLACPCHGSRFSGNGDVTQGPARLPLQHYAVEVGADGGVTVCPSTQVASTTRIPV